ncbi:zinc-binding dehydrogenase [Nocardioides carbamazepini]|uniref:zinc-binding dehydrogenase n=1 Tax=Nocardioides carbamazepini TaxID=2854259 RepID=UPI00214A32D9|nr:zinc-binding dehydrogenase [Nocardioides carbamazepini]MCR1781094.1 zinc-binding dehydrogenase [Nocardioides carbamazepini]
MPRRVTLDAQLTPSVAESVGLPAPGAGQIRVRVVRAGVNFWEVMQRRGRVPAPADGVPGTEGVGVVDELGAGVTAPAVGDRVAWSKVPGSYADQVVGPADSFVSVPDEVDDDTAAGLLFQGTTAAYLCEAAWPVAQGDPVVVTSASGGVGLLLTQLLVARGAVVVGAVSSPDKAGASRDAGAARVLTYGGGLAEEIRTLHPEGVAAVFDAVGAGVVEPLVATLRPRGALVLYGAASGKEAQIGASDLGRGSLFLTRTAGRDYLPTSDVVAEYSRMLLALAGSGRLRVRVDRVLPLEDTMAAWDALESRRSIGKILLAP